MLPTTCTRSVMKILLYILGLLTAFIGGFVFCWWLKSFSMTGAQLRQDVIIFDNDHPIATINQGAVLLKNKFMPRYSFLFDLANTNVNIIDSKDTYYSDTKLSGTEPIQKFPKD